jgi:hypothetical protein
MEHAAASTTQIYVRYAPDPTDGAAFAQRAFGWAEARAVLWMCQVERIALDAKVFSARSRRRPAASSAYAVHVCRGGMTWRPEP